jgi:hypothetical protein
MEISYSKNGTGFAYTFTKSELSIVRLGFKREISRLKKNIKKWDEDERNEGQTTWLDKIETARRLIRIYEKYIEELTFKKN